MGILNKKNIIRNIALVVGIMFVAVSAILLSRFRVRCNNSVDSDVIILHDYFYDYRNSP